MVSRSEQQTPIIEKVIKAGNVFDVSAIAVGVVLEKTSLIWGGLASLAIGYLGLKLLRDRRERKKSQKLS